MCFEDKEFEDIMKELETIISNNEELLAMLSIDKTEEYAHQELLVINSKIKLYEFLSKQHQRYDDSTMDFFKRKVEMLKNIKKHNFIIKYPNKELYYTDDL